MKCVIASHEILTPISKDGLNELRMIEKAARTSYKSEYLIQEQNADSAKVLIRKLIKNGHEACLEHGGMTVKFICDRGISHEIVRHRLASYTQESTRYCNYTSDKFEKEISVVYPSKFLVYDTEDEEAKQALDIWKQACLNAEFAYFEMISHGVAPEIARSVLPNSLKTELVMTANWREWRHFFKLRCDIHAHPDMRVLACDLLFDIHERIPVLFDDIFEEAF